MTQRLYQVVKLILLLLISFLPVVSGMAQEVRKFSTADGSSSVLATLVRVDTDSSGASVAVLRRKADGFVVRVRVTTLSPEDIKYITASDELFSVPVNMRGRLTPVSRAEWRQKCGSSAVAAEAAVERTLHWLNTNQNPNGSWGKSHPAAMTGLALLVFAGHGHGPASPQYGKVITNGINSLLETAQKNLAPFAGILSDHPGTTISTYEHGIATQALAEMFALSQHGKKAPAGLGDMTAKAEGIILLKQSRTGAWGYKDGLGYDPLGGNDLSVTGWQIHAVCACRDAGFSNEKRSKVLQMAMNYLKQKQSQEGGFGNANRTEYYNQWNLTGSALSGMQLCGKTPLDTGRGMNWLEALTKKEPLKWESECYLYTWYFNSMALHRAGGEAWSTWNAQSEPLLLANQNPDGSWKVEGVGDRAAAGSGAAAGDKEIYRACLASLILETPCRFIPADTAK
jgi:hypothetical protein